MMFNRCSYCDAEDCWGHTNDEKSTLDRAKQSEKTASAYYNQIELLCEREKELEQAISDLLQVIIEDIPHEYQVFNFLETMQRAQATRDHKGKK